MLYDIGATFAFNEYVDFYINKLFALWKNFVWFLSKKHSIENTTFFVW